MRKCTDSQTQRPLGLYSPTPLGPFRQMAHLRVSSSTMGRDATKALLPTAATIIRIRHAGGLFNRLLRRGATTALLLRSADAMGRDASR